MSANPAPVLIDAVNLPSADLMSFFGDFAEALVGENRRIMPRSWNHYTTSGCSLMTSNRGWPA